MEDPQPIKKTNWFRSPFVRGGMGALLVAAATVAWPDLYNDVFAVKHKIGLYGTMVQVFASLLGFVMTAASILVAFHVSIDNVVMTALKRNKKAYRMIFTTFIRACWSLGLSAILAFLLMRYDVSGATNRFVAGASAWLYLFTGFLVWSCIHQLGKLIGIILSVPSLPKD